jgi:hypothetical protein
LYSRIRIAGIVLAQKFPGGEIFGAKSKIRIFFRAKKILPIRAIRIFCTKTGTAEKFTTEKEYVSQVYTRYPGNYPVTGWLLHILFSGRKLYCRFFSGLKSEKSKKFFGQKFFGHVTLSAKSVRHEFFYEQQVLSGKTRSTYARTTESCKNSTLQKSSPEQIRTAVARSRASHD